MIGTLGGLSGLFDDFRRLQDEIDQMLGGGAWPAGIRSVAPGTYPPINVGSTADRVDIYLFAAGLDPAKLDISIEKNLLSVSGERKAPLETGVEYYRKERFDGAFRRVITLPEDIDADRVKAHYRDGILQIEIPRREASKPRRIKVD